MLEFEKILPEINKITDIKLETERKKPELVEEAIQILKSINPDSIHYDEIYKLRYFVGIPVEHPLFKKEADSLSLSYIAIATDGSAIAPNPDFIFDYYLINVGYAAIRYGEGHFFESGSVPKIFYKPDDLYEMINGNKYLVRGELLQAKMLLEESKMLANKIEQFRRSDIPIIALIDGTLIQWEIKGGDEPYKKHFIKSFESLFKQSEKIGMPVAGYISGSHSKDVVGLIKFIVEESVSKEEAEKFNVLEDRDIFEVILKNRERSALFMSTVPILQYYSAPVYFFYINTGREIARIEVPHFVLRIKNGDSRDGVSLVHNLVLSQSEKGKGYPVVLREAHEQTVIRNSEKFALENLFRENFAKRGIIFIGDKKTYSKETRII